MREYNKQGTTGIEEFVGATVVDEDVPGGGVEDGIPDEDNEYSPEEDTTTATGIEVTHGLSTIQTLLQSMTVNDEPAVVEDSFELIKRHVGDEFRDHIKSDVKERKPKIVIRFANALKNLGHNPAYKAKSQNEDEDRHFADLEVEYNIKGVAVCGDLVAFDNAYLDLTMKYDKDNREATNCLRTWCNVYFTIDAMRIFSSIVELGTGYKVDFSEFTLDKAQGLLSFTVNIDEDDPPTVNVYTTNPKTHKLMLMNAGRVPEACAAEQDRKIFKGTVFIGMSASVYAPIGTPPSPSAHGLHLKMELLGCRLYGIADVKVVRLGKKTRGKV
jgi:hypothetical protein